MPDPKVNPYTVLSVLGMTIWQFKLIELRRRWCSNHILTITFWGGPYKWQTDKSTWLHQNWIHNVPKSGVMPTLLLNTTRTYCKSKMCCPLRLKFDPHTSCRLVNGFDICRWLTLVLWGVSIVASPCLSMSCLFLVATCPLDVVLMTYKMVY